MYISYIDQPLIIVAIEYTFKELRWITKEDSENKHQSINVFGFMKNELVDFTSLEADAQM